MNDELRTARRSRALLQALSTDFLLREQFVTDPAGILSEYVGGQSKTPDATNAANQLLYAVVSNPQLLHWLRDRVAGSGRNLSNAALASSLASAVGRSGDEAAVAALIRCGSGKDTSVEPALNLLRTLGLALSGEGRELAGGAAPGSKLRPGVEAGTEFTPGTGTEFTPGTGTESTPGTGTELSAGQGTEFTPGTGTEFTPGTGTESTPGTGTESTPGGIVVDWGEFQVTLQALVQYATQLRRVGALAETGFE
jgi:hypothetical protein